VEKKEVAKKVEEPKREVKRVEQKNNEVKKEEEVYTAPLMASE
jgi:hypothetical protein